MHLPYRHLFAAELARADQRLRPTFWNGLRRFFHDPRPVRVEVASTDLPSLIALKRARAQGRETARHPTPETLSHERRPHRPVRLRRAFERAAAVGL